ncbi:hypothetical protein BS78_06G201800 [Paspalum vaginatum]|nr:hypothetical protein BS78_06G201800 [Paspalum vaginatum]
MPPRTSTRPRVRRLPHALSLRALMPSTLPTPPCVSTDLRVRSLRRLCIAASRCSYHRISKDGSCTLRDQQALSGCPRPPHPILHRAAEATGE